MFPEKYVVCLLQLFQGKKLSTGVKQLVKTSMQKKCQKNNITNQLKQIDQVALLLNRNTKEFKKDKKLLMDFNNTRYFV